LLSYIFSPRLKTYPLVLFAGKGDLCGGSQLEDIKRFAKFEISKKCHAKWNFGLLYWNQIKRKEVSGMVQKLWVYKSWKTLVCVDSYENGVLQGLIVWREKSLRRASAVFWSWGCWWIAYGEVWKDVRLYK
jgi:hypothetical protein